MFPGSGSVDGAGLLDAREAIEEQTTQLSTEKGMTNYLNPVSSFSKESLGVSQTPMHNSKLPLEKIR
jgi:hypothetical protein